MVDKASGALCSVRPQWKRPLGEDGTHMRPGQMAAEAAGTLLMAGKPALLICLLLLFCTAPYQGTPAQQATSHKKIITLVYNRGVIIIIIRQKI